MGRSALVSTDGNAEDDEMGNDWVVGLDGSPSSRCALQWAVGMAEASGTTVTTLTAWHVPLSISIQAGRRPVEVDRLGLRAEAEVIAAEASSLAPSSALGEPAVVEGHPAAALLRASNPESCVVVGRRGTSDLQHLLLGSVSQYLATHAPGPVVVVPTTESPRPCRRIVVGFDGSEHAVAALRWVLAIAPEDAEVEVLIVIDAMPWLVPQLLEGRYPPEVTADKQRLLDAVADIDVGSRARCVVVVDRPRKALADASEHADLVVVGPRGLDIVTRTILGSVTTWLLHHSSCPVAVVPSA